MKILFKILLIAASFAAFGQGDSTGIAYSMNGRPIDERQLELISPRKIKKIEIIKSSSPTEVRIWTKKIHFLSYGDIKEKLDNLFIDKSAIKKMGKNKNGDIEIRTINFNKSQGLKRNLRGTTSARNRVYMSGWSDR